MFFVENSAPQGFIQCAVLWQHESRSTSAQVMAGCLRHQVTWINVDLSLGRFYGIHLRIVSWQMSKLLFWTMSLKIIYLKLLPHLPGINELTRWHLYPHVLQVELEMSAQLDFFQTLAGYHPLYVDGHQHVHILPGLADTFARVLCKHGVYSTRLPYEPNIAECDWIDAPRQGFYQEVSQQSLDARATFDHWGIW